MIPLRDCNCPSDDVACPIFYTGQRIHGTSCGNTLRVMDHTRGDAVTFERGATLSVVSISPSFKLPYLGWNPFSVYSSPIPYRWTPNDRRFNLPAGNSQCANFTSCGRTSLVLWRYPIVFAEFVVVPRDDLHLAAWISYIKQSTFAMLTQYTLCQQAMDVSGAQSLRPASYPGD